GRMVSALMARPLFAAHAFRTRYAGHDTSTMTARDVGGRVMRLVVDNDDFKVRIVDRGERSEKTRQVVLFVTRRNDQRHFRPMAFGNALFSCPRAARKAR